MTVSGLLVAGPLVPDVGAAPSCLLPSERRMIVAELFFGRDIQGRAPLSESEWSVFAARVVAKQFPDGFTVQDGEGAWMDPGSHEMVRESAKILTVALPASDSAARKLEVVISAYRKEYRQRSVGVLTQTMCGTF